MARRVDVVAVIGRALVASAAGAGHRRIADQWIRAWRAGGFEALKPKPRALSLKVPREVLDMAEALKREAPERTAAQVGHILSEACGWAPNERTLQRHFRWVGLTRSALSSARVAFGRFEASHPSELWVGDALHGPIIDRHKAILFAFLDDHSRLLTGYRWVTIEVSSNPSGEGSRSRLAG